MITTSAKVSRIKKLGTFLSIEKEALGTLTQTKKGLIL